MSAKERWKDLSGMFGPKNGLDVYFKTKLSWDGTLPDLLICFVLTDHFDLLPNLECLSPWLHTQKFIA